MQIYHLQIPQESLQPELTDISVQYPRRASSPQLEYLLKQVTDGFGTSPGQRPQADGQPEQLLLVCALKY